MSGGTNSILGNTLLSSLFMGNSFVPPMPKTLAESGLTDTLVDSLVLKSLLVDGGNSGRQIAESLGLSFGVMDERFRDLRNRSLITHKSAAMLNDYNFVLTQEGRDAALRAMAACAYTGAAPVPLNDYVASVDAQSISAEVPKQADLEKAFSDISVNPKIYSRLGPAINSGAGLFLYGEPGNGKTTLAERITLCFGHQIWIPRTVIADGQLIKLYDPAYHESAEEHSRSILKTENDRRWIRIRRPTVIAGGEMTMDSLEIRHDSNTNVAEAPLQMKSNCGSLLIDDFGRQRVDPVELLNRWIVPLEKRYDFLTLKTGKKIQVPFDQLIIFSTNLEPSQLVDEAFLRRIPYKINVPDPEEGEFYRLFQMSANAVGCVYRPEAVDYVVNKHYKPFNRGFRRCHPRDLLLQIYNYCKYMDLPVEMTPEYFDIAVENYFTVVIPSKT